MSGIKCNRCGEAALNSEKYWVHDWRDKRYYCETCFKEKEEGVSPRKKKKSKKKVKVEFEI